MVMCRRILHGHAEFSGTYLQSATLETQSIFLTEMLKTIDPVRVSCIYKVNMGTDHKHAENGTWVSGK